MSLLREADDPRLPMMMTDVDRLLRDYIERFEAGGSVDPSDLWRARARTGESSPC